MDVNNLYKFQKTTKPKYVCSDKAGNVLFASDSLDEFNALKQKYQASLRESVDEEHLFGEDPKESEEF